MSVVRLVVYRSIQAGKEGCSAVYYSEVVKETHMLQCAAMQGSRADLTAPGLVTGTRSL